MNAVGWCAEHAKSLGRLSILSGDEIDLAYYTAHQRADTAISREAVIAEPAVDDCYASPVLLGRRNEVRPKLQFGQHQERWPHATNGSPHCPTEIQRAVKHGEVGILCSGQLVSCPAGSRDDELPIGVLAAKLDQQRRQQIHFADAHSVNPDTSGVAVASRN